MLSKLRQELDAFYYTKLPRAIFKPFLLPFFLIHKLFERRYPLVMDHLEIVVSTRCSLRCRKCANLMQYYKTPVDFPVDVLKQDIRKLLELGIFFERINLLGGEPFLYRDLPELIAMLQNARNVQSIRIVTNGTVIPSPALVESLKASKIILFISNYINIGAKTNEVYRILKDAGVNVTLYTGCWFNYHHNFAKGGYNRTPEQCRAIYQTCNMACHELFDGEVHLCPTSANGMRLGLVPRDDRSCVSIRHDGSKKEKAAVIANLKRLLTECVPNACQYCDGGNGEIIPVAEQLPVDSYLAADGTIQKRHP